MRYAMKLFGKEVQTCFYLLIYVTEREISFIQEADEDSGDDKADDNDTSG